MIPVIGTSATISPDWYKSVAAAVGASTLASSFHADNLVTETSGPAYGPFQQAIMSEKGKVGSTGNFDTYLTAPGAVHLYDAINLAALAMVEAKSTSPSVWWVGAISCAAATPKRFATAAETAHVERNQRPKRS